MPEEFRNYSTIQYSWSGMFSGTGSRLTIGPLYKEDNMKNVTCTAKDQGASDKLSAQQNISIIVYCEYSMYSSILIRLYSYIFTHLALIIKYQIKH